MAEINYTLTFHSDWHCGSGLSAGADVDALVVKDKDGLPFVPGKTLKGLIKEAVIDILVFKKEYDAKRSLIVETFGNSKDRNALDGLLDNGSTEDDYQFLKQGVAFFGNAEFDDDDRNVIVQNHVQKLLFRELSSTAINPDGVAKKNSLRKIQVTIPCVLKGKISNVPVGLENVIKEALSYIKRLGQNRNRGLGRCSFTY